MSKSTFLFTNQIATAENLTASSEALPVTNLVNPQRTRVWRSTANTASISFSLTDIAGADYLALVDLNLTSTGVIRVRAWDDAVDGSMLTFDQYYDPVIFVSGSEADINYSGGDYGLGAFGLANSIASSSRKNVNLFPFGQVVLSPFYKVDLIDENLTYIQAGIMFLSKARTYDINLAYNWNISQIDRSVSKESIAGQKYIQPRDTRLQISGRFPALSETERTDTIVDITEMGTTKPFIYSVFPENNNIGLTTTVYGSFSDSNLTNNFTNRNEFNFTVVEDL
jgi:hypothetical protein